MAPALVQTVRTETAIAASSITHANLAVGSGTNRSLVAYVSWQDNTGVAAPTVSSVVFNTTENFVFGQRARINWATDNYAIEEIWYLDNPSNATANVIAALSETNDTEGLAITVQEWTGANNGIGANKGTATGNSTAPQCTFTTLTSTGMICAGICAVAAPTTFAPIGSENERMDDTIGSISYWAADLASATASQTIGATITSGRWGCCAIELLATGAAESASISPSLSLSPRQV